MFQVWKSIFATVIIRYYRWKKITKETSKVITKSTYRGNNQMEFRKCITRGILVHFRSTIDTSRSKTRRIQFIIFIFIKKAFLFQLMALRRSLLRIDKAFLFETFGSLNIRNIGYTPICFQLLRKSMSSLSLSCLYFNS